MADALRSFSPLFVGSDAATHDIGSERSTPECFQSPLRRVRRCNLFLPSI